MHSNCALALAGGPLLALLCGCASIPEGRAAVDSLRVVGAHEVAQPDIIDRIATEDSPKFLGLLRGVAYDYSIYDPAVLQRDLARVERYYRGRGFFEAHARVGRVHYVGSDHVRIEIVVDEGRPMLNRQVRVDGLDPLPANIASAVRAASAGALPAKARFDEDAYAKARDTLARALTDRGYAYAKVTADARADLASHSVDYVLTVSPGIAAVFGPITIVGLDPDGAGPAPQEIEEGPLRRAIHIRQGSPYSTAEIESATQALLDLEVFSAVHIVPGLGDPPTPVVPLVVQAEPTKLRAWRIGGGFEFDAIKTDVHGVLGWENHNLLGGLRDLSIDFKPGVVLYPMHIGSKIPPPSQYFPEERLRLQFRQPGFLESRTTGFVQPEFNIYPLLVEPNPDVTQNVVGYVEPKASIGVERRYGKYFFAKLLYNVQGELPFSYFTAASTGPDRLSEEKQGVPPLSPTGNVALPSVLLSFPQLLAQLQVVDDPTHPHEGFAANLDLQVAGGPFGGTASDVRIQPDASGYIPITRGITFAVYGSLGFLFPLANSYGQEVEKLPSPSNNTTQLAQDIQTVYFRGFFSGGPSSNRGFPLRGVSPHGYVPFLNPGTAAVQAANNCDPSRVSSAHILGNPKCATPIGGFSMWEASVELRFAVTGPLGAAIFCDASDVSQHVHELRFNYLHASCGVGGRYDTPVGPIRLDIGWRVPWLQILGQPDETRAQASDSTFGSQPRIGPAPNGDQPIAIAFGIGEAF
jgi:outer membrane translocation and assembly module TamA